VGGTHDKGSLHWKKGLWSPARHPKSVKRNNKNWEKGGVFQKKFHNRGKTDRGASLLKKI